MACFSRGIALAFATVSSAGRAACELAAAALAGASPVLGACKAFGSACIAACRAASRWRSSCSFFSLRSCWSCSSFLRACSAMAKASTLCFRAGA